MFLDWPELELSGFGNTHDLYRSAHGDKGISPLGFATDDSSCLSQTVIVDDTTPSIQSLIDDVCGI